MQTSTPFNCEGCGLLIYTQQAEYCPRCKYPLSLAQEESFLEVSIRHLRLIETHGGADFPIPRLLKLHSSILLSVHDLRCSTYYADKNLTLQELTDHYQLRLEHLRQLKALEAVSEDPDATLKARSAWKSKLFPQSLEREKTVAMEEVLSTGQTTDQQKSPISQLILSVNTLSTNDHPSMPHRTLSASTNIPLPKRVRAPRINALKSFFVDSPISLMVSLGAFLILMAALNFVVNFADPIHHPNPLLAFLVVLGTQVFFAAAGIGTQRLSRFPNVARIYTFVFVLLIPLLGIEGYQVLQRQTMHFSLPAVIAFAALYAALAYCGFAIYQRFSPFGYLGMMAVVATALATVAAFHLGPWWYPATLMILALPGLATVPKPSGHFTSPLAVLRNPIRISMFITVFCVICAIPMILYFVLEQDAFGLNAPHIDVRNALLGVLLLLLVWGVIFLWMTMHRILIRAVPFLFLIGILIFAHLLGFDAMGYAFTLTVLALLYHGVSRLAPHLPEPFAKLDLRLDQLALLFVSTVPFISTPQILFLLLTLVPAPFSPVTGWLSVIVLSMNALLTLTILLHRTNVARVVTSEVQSIRWPWLLLLSGALLNWAYDIAVILLHGNPTYCFLGLILAIVVVTIAVRRRFGALWANPLDVLTLGMVLILLTESFITPSAGNLASLLLFFATLSYGILLFQQRCRPLLLPFLFAASALYLLLPAVVLAMAVLLPIASIGVQRLFSGESPITTFGRLIFSWEWPLLAIGLLSGLIVSVHDIQAVASTMQGWLGINLPAAIEVASLSLIWYLSAALTRTRWKLFLATGFAVVALVYPAHPLWILAGLTPVAAFAGLAITRFAGKVWAAPLYTCALLSAVLIGVRSPTAMSFAEYSLFVFAAISYVISMVEDTPVYLLIALVFASWSLIDSAWQHDPTRLIVVAMLCAVIGIGIHFLRPLIPASQREKTFRYMLPFYITALVAAVLTGTYATVVGSQGPFYGAILLAFALLAGMIMLIERAPEVVVFPAGLAGWAVWLMHLDISLQIALYCLLCVLIFASQFIWKLVPPATSRLSPIVLARFLGLVGQVFVVLSIIRLGGLTPATAFAQPGGEALFVLALLVVWSGYTQHVTSVRHWCLYGAGFLVAMVISWELLASGQTKLDILTLAPASYLSVIAPFLMRDKVLPASQRAGQVIAVIGAALLLLPTSVVSVISNHQDSLISTLLLLGEALALFFLGIAARIRFFILGGAGLVIVGTLRALFLPSSFIPIWAVLAVSGGALLAGATVLTLRIREERLSEAE